MRTLALCITLIALLTVPAIAQDANALDPMQYSATLFGSDNLMGARLELLGQRTGWGPEFLWQDGLSPGDAQAWGIGGFARYDLMKEQTLQVLNVAIPTTVYVGVRAGVLYSEDGQMVSETGNVSTDRWDAQAGLVLGTVFGDSRNQIGFEAWAAATPKLWEEFADKQDSYGVVVTLTRRF